MGCRCNERRQAIGRAAGAIVRGDLRSASAAGQFVARTLAQDARSGALRQAAAAQLARLRPPVRR
ncbi:hypothetical protein DY467_07555 [Rhodopseudomonas sp. BR0G17]|nr:hypothetical protein [Rhodopseudomonas sp. BR0G17]